MSKVDFSTIRLKHAAWRTMINDFLDGKKSMSEEQAFSHEACDLGKWLYSDGMTNYGTMTEMQELEKVHIELHLTVRSIMSLKQSGNISAEEKELTKLDTILRKINLLLVTIEQKLL